MTTIRASSTTARRLKIAAAHAGRTMTSLITEIVEDALERRDRDKTRLGSAERPARRPSPE
jgi:predicted DNA-binding protein